MASLSLMAPVLCQNYYTYRRAPYVFESCINRELRASTKIEFQELFTRHVHDISLTRVYLAVGDRASEYFHETQPYYTDEDISSAVEEYIVPLMGRRVDFGISEETMDVRSQLIHLVIEAVKKCTDEQIFAPLFPDEPKHLANFLNFMLINWTTPLNVLADTQEGRSQLRTTANYALCYHSFHLSSLSSASIDQVRQTVMRTWMRRAGRYFDARRPNYPFLPYYFNSSNPPDYVVCANNNTNKCDIMGILTNPDTIRPPANWDDRNPLADQGERTRLLNIYRPFNLSNPNEAVDLRVGCVFDHLAFLSRPELTAAELYFLRLYDINMRILFVHREMSIITETNENWHLHPIPPHLLPILHDDSAWSEYLAEQRRLYLQLGFQPEVDRVTVEDLVHSKEFFERKAAN